MAVIASNALRISTVFKDNDGTYVVLKYAHIKKGRGQATIRVKVRNIKTGSITEKTYTNEQKVESADVEKRTTQYLYKDEKMAYFMDNFDFSQFELPVESIEWQLNFLKEGDSVVSTFLEGECVGIEIPKTADLAIIETSDAVNAGNTATNTTKQAVTETGFSLQVPLFIKQGESVKINTDEGTYVSRS